MRTAFDARTTKLRALVHAVATNASYNGEECPICLTTLTTETAVLPKCGHMFHRPCIAQHMAVRAGAGCPVCRRALSPRALVRVRSGIPDQDSPTANVILSAALDKLAVELDCNREVGVLMAAVEVEQGRIRRMKMEIEEDGRLTRVAREEYRNKRDEASKQLFENRKKEAVLERREREMNRAEEHRRQDYLAANLQLNRMRDEAAAAKMKYSRLCKAMEKRMVEGEMNGGKKRGTESEIIDLTECSPLKKRLKRERVGLTDRELEMLTHKPEMVSRKKRRVRENGQRIAMRRSRRRLIAEEQERISAEVEAVNEERWDEARVEELEESSASRDIMSALMEEEEDSLRIEADEGENVPSTSEELAVVGGEEATQGNMTGYEASENEFSHNNTEKDEQMARDDEEGEEDETTETDRLTVQLRLCAPTVRTRLRRPSRLDGESFNAAEAETERGRGRLKGRRRMEKRVGGG